MRDILLGMFVFFGTVSVACIVSMALDHWFDVTFDSNDDDMFF